MPIPIRPSSLFNPRPAGIPTFRHRSDFESRDADIRAQNRIERERKRKERYAVRDAAAAERRRKRLELRGTREAERLGRLRLELEDTDSPSAKYGELPPYLLRAM
jgi:hypothetical protein